MHVIMSIRSVTGTDFPTAIANFETLLIVACIAASLRTVQPPYYNATWLHWSHSSVSLCRVFQKNGTPV